MGNDADMENLICNRQLEILAQASRQLNSVLDEQMIMRTLVEYAIQLLDATSGAGGILIDGKVVFKEYNEAGLLLPIDYSFEPGYGIPGCVIKSAEPYISNDAENDPNVISEIQEALNFYNLIDVPIFDRRGELIGCFEIHNKKDHLPFDKNDVNVLQILAQSAAIALDNARFINELEQTNEALRDSEERYRLLFESNPQPMWVFDLDTFQFLAVNDAAINHYGYSKEEFLSMRTIDIRPKEDVPALLEKLPKTTSGIQQEGVWRHVKKDGTIIDADITSHTLNFAGRPAKLVLAIDITQRLETENALKEAEAKYRSLVEKSVVGVYVIQNDRFIYVNPRWTEILGYSQDEAINKLDIYETIVPEDRELVKNNIRDRIDGKVESANYSFSAIRKDGKVINVEVYGSRTIMGGKPAVIGTAIDITERIKTEHALYEAENKYRNLVEGSIFGVYIIQGDHFQYVNPRFAEMFGYSVDELNNKRVSELVAPESREIVLKNVQMRLQGKLESIHYTFKGLRKDGRIIDVEVYGSAANFENKPSVIGSIIDITDRTLAESSLMASEERYRLLFERSPDIVMILKDDKFTSVSPAITRILGYTPEEWIGFKPWEKSPEFQADGISSVEKGLMYMRLARDVGPQVLDWVHIHKDGHLVDVEVSLVAFTLHNEMYYQSIVRDISERKRAEEHRRLLEQRMEEQKRQFYRQTILSVTDGKLDIADTADIRPYIISSQLKIKVNNAAEVSDARHMVEEFFISKGLAGDRLDGFMIGVGEAITNAIKHASKGCVYAGTTNAFTRGGEAVWVAIADRGTGINSLVLPRATLLRGFSTKPSLGLGYSIMLDCADHILLKTGEKGTIVILIKHIVDSHSSILFVENLPDTWDSIPSL